MTERERLVERMAAAMEKNGGSWVELADKALRVVEEPKGSDELILICNCGHSGYNEPHKAGCPLE